MARKREFDERNVIDALKSIFWRKGYEGASYAGIMDATGLGKGSLYKAFGGKRDLYLRALSDYIAIEVQEAIDLLNGDLENFESSETPHGRDRIEMLFDKVIEPVETSGDRRGCYLCNSAIDLAPLDKDVETITVSALDAMRDAFKQALSFVSGPEQQALTAENMLTTYFGMRVLAKAGVSPEDLNRAKEAALRALREGKR